MLAISETGGALVKDSHVAVRPGDGLVGRFADTVIVVASEGDETASEELLAAIEAESGAHDRSGLELARSVAGLLVAGGLPTFGLVAPVGDLLVILLRGTVQAEVTTSVGAMTFTGEESLTWLDHCIRLPVDRIDVHLATTALPPDLRSDLRAGRVPGGGFVLTFGTAPPARGAGSAAAPRFGAERSSPSVPPASPPPDAGTGTPARPAPAATPVQSHATMPTWAVVVSPPGAETVVHSIQVGALVADDGSRLPLDRSYVLGREPHHDPSVETGGASPIVVHDPDSLISRVQVYVSVNEDGMTVRDAESANGTFIAAAGASEWTKLDDRVTPLPVGWSLRIGKRIYTHVGPPS